MKSIQIGKNETLEDIRNMRGGFLSCDVCLVKERMERNRKIWIERERERRRRYKNLVGILDISN